MTLVAELGHFCFTNQV